MCPSITFFNQLSQQSRTKKCAFAWFALSVFSFIAGAALTIQAAKLPEQEDDSQQLAYVWAVSGCFLGSGIFVLAALIYGWCPEKSETGLSDVESPRAKHAYASYGALN